MGIVILYQRANNNKHIRVGPDIRPFSISSQKQSIETIRIPDIRLIYNAGYPAIRPDILRWPDIRPNPKTYYFLCLDVEYMWILWQEKNNRIISSFLRIFKCTRLTPVFIESAFEISGLKNGFNFKIVYFISAESCL